MYWPATLACTAFLSVYWPPTLACTCYLSNVLGGTTSNRKFEVNIRVGRYNILLVWGHFDFAKSPSKSFFDTMSDLTLFPLALFLYLSLFPSQISHFFDFLKHTFRTFPPRDIFTQKIFLFLQNSFYVYVFDCVFSASNQFTYFTVYFGSNPPSLSFFLHSALIAPRWSSVLFSLPIPRLQSFSWLCLYVRVCVGI